MNAIRAGFPTQAHYALGNGARGNQYHLVASGQQLGDLLYPAIYGIAVQTCAIIGQSLSQRRAETCVDYLKENGVVAERMVAVGYGEDALLGSDAEIARLPKEDQERAHQRNRRTVFKIVAFDYKPAE